MSAIAYSELLGLIAQTGPNVDVGVGPGVGVVGGAVGAFLTTLVVGGIMLAVAPEYTERMQRVVLDDPVETFVYGFLALLLLLVVTIVLAITLTSSPP